MIEDNSIQLRRKHQIPFYLVGYPITGRGHKERKCCNVKPAGPKRGQLSKTSACTDLTQSPKSSPYDGESRISRGQPSHRPQAVQENQGRRPYNYGDIVLSGYPSKED